jgi:hypothetical protein
VITETSFCHHLGVRLKAIKTQKPKAFALGFLLFNKKEKICSDFAVGFTTLALSKEELTVI